jgi:hypothetical protein
LADMAKILEDGLFGPTLAGAPQIPCPDADRIDPVLSGRQLRLIVDNCEHRDGASETNDGVRPLAISGLPSNQREQNADSAEKAGGSRVQIIICIELQGENGPKLAE